MASKEIYEIPLNADDFLQQISENRNAFKEVKHHTTEAIAHYATTKNLVKQSFNSLKVMSKDKLLDLILESQNPATAEKSVIKSSSNNSEALANDLIEILNQIKKDIQNKPLNKVIHNQAIKSLSKLINRIEDDKTLENVGLVGNIIVLIITFIDTFIDIKTIPQKIKEFREKRAIKNNDEE